MQGDLGHQEDWDSQGLWKCTWINSFLMITGKSRSWEELFSIFLVHIMNVILNLQKRCTSLWDRYQGKTLFIFEVSVNWATNRNWQIKVLDTWKVAQLNLLHQKSVKCAQYVTITACHMIVSSFSSSSSSSVGSATSQGFSFLVIFFGGGMHMWSFFFIKR